MISELLTTVRPAVETPLSWRILPSSRADEALAIWWQLEQRIENSCPGSVGVACRPTWTECWIRHYGDLVPYRFAVAESSGVVRGITLLTEGVGQKLGPFPLRTLHLGTAGEPQPGSVCVEYNRPLVEAGREREFVDGLSQLAHQDRRWEQFRLDGISEGELQPWSEHFPGAEVRLRDSRYFDFNVARDHNSDVISQLGKSTRANLRRRIRQYESLDCDWATNPDTAADIFEELVHLHQARWQAVGQPGAFASERFLRFQSEVALKLFLEQRAVLFRVRHAGETVGCLFLLVDRNRLLDYLSGFADFEVKPSPGLISHYLCMEQALQRGYDAYDFLVGDKRHKENLSNSVTQLGWLTWTRPTWKMSAISALQAMKRRFGQSKVPPAAETNDTNSVDQQN